MEAAPLRGCDELGALGTLVLAMKALGLSLVLLLAVTATSAQELTPTAPGAFRVSLDQDQHPVAGRIIGQVHNGSSLRVTDVRLEVRGLDTDGRVVGRTFGWAFGDIAPGGDTSFEFEAMSDASNYQIGVVSYDVVSSPAVRQSP